MGPRIVMYHQLRFFSRSFSIQFCSKGFAMSTFITVLWGLVVLYVVWGVFCLATVGSMKEIDPASWHYSWVSNASGSAPNNTCYYWTKLFIAPAYLMSMLIGIFIGYPTFLMYEFFRLMIKFLIFGRIPDRKEFAHDHKSGKK